MKEKKALILMDFINEIIHPDGKFKGKGYADFAIKNNVLQKVNQAIKVARENEIEVIFVKVGFNQDYKNQPKNSILFGKAHEFKALSLGTWSTELESSIDMLDTDLVVIKNRISPFYGTNLDSYLRNNNISSLYFAGVATDLVVQSAARDAHDRDYNVFIIPECCAAGSDEDHSTALTTMSKISTIISLSDF